MKLKPEWWGAQQVQEETYQGKGNLYYYYYYYCDDDNSLKSLTTARR